MKNMGDGRRVARVEREVQSIISTFIIQRLQSELPGLITVARVMIPADLRSAKVFVSLLQTHLDQEKAVEIDDVRAAKAGKKVSELEQSIDILQSWAGEMQNEIGSKLNMKYLPKLTFYADESTNKILKIEKILSDIKGSNSVGDDDLDD